MCGRFTLRTPASQWAQLFLPQLAPELSPADQPPRFNIAPTQSIDCVLQEQAGQLRSVVQMRWGLVPSWADDRAIGNRMINARGETVESKPSFRKAFARRRCLIPADGYYEWKKVDDGKQPYLIERSDGGMLAMAGLWEENRKVADDGQPLRTCTVITTSANPTTSSLHDRMPVFLETSDHDRWLDPGFHEVDALKALLSPAPSDRLKLTAVSRHVNSPRNDDPACVVPVGESG